jgi:hypothetical protein
MTRPPFVPRQHSGSRELGTAPVCFVAHAFAPLSSPTQIADADNQRVQEVDPQLQSFVRFIGVGELSHLSGIAVSDQFVAVAGTCWLFPRARAPCAPPTPPHSPTLSYVCLPGEGAGTVGWVICARTHPPPTRCGHAGVCTPAACGDTLVLPLLLPEFERPSMDEARPHGYIPTYRVSLFDLATGGLVRRIGKAGFDDGELRGPKVRRLSGYRQCLL